MTQDRSSIAQFNEMKKLSKVNPIDISMSKAYWLSCEQASEAKEKISKIDLISLNKSNETSSTLNDDTTLES